MKLIVNSADYGMSDCITDGCLHAIREGILNTVGLMTNNACSERAVAEIKKFSHVTVGQEINLVFGKPVSDPKLVPSLVNQEGRLITTKERMNQYGVKNLLDLEKSDDPNMGLVYEEVLLETENQVKRFIEMMGSKPLYIGGHSITTPYITKARNEVAEKYGINQDWKTRLHHDPQRWYQNYSKTKAGFTVEMQANTDVVGYILEDRGNLLKHDYSLLSTHCGFFDKDLMDLSTFHVIRGIECSALCDSRVKKWIEKNNIELINAEQFFKEMKIQ